MTLAGSQIHGERRVAGLEMLNRLHVRIGEVVHVNVVANARSVWSGIVGAENVQLRTFARSGLKS